MPLKTLTVSGRRLLFLVVAVVLPVPTVVAAESTITARNAESDCVSADCAIEAEAADLDVRLLQVTPSGTAKAVTSEAAEEPPHVRTYRQHVADVASARDEALKHLQALDAELEALGAPMPGGMTATDNSTELAAPALMQRDGFHGAHANGDALRRRADVEEAALEQERRLWSGTNGTWSGPKGDLIYQGARASAWSQVVFKPYDMGVPCFRIPSVVITPQNTLIAFAEARYMYGKAKCSDHAAAQIVGRRSRDGGHTWENAFTVVGSQSNKKGNPNGIILPDKEGVARYPLGYRVLLLYVHHDDQNTGIKTTGNGMVFSDDDGVHWSKEVDISKSLYNGLPGPGTGAVYTQNGRIIVAAHHAPGAGSLLVSSDDHGKTWTVRRANFYDHDNEPTVAELPNGDIFFSGRQWKPRHGRGVFFSHDEGISWNAFDGEGDVNARPTQHTALIGAVCQNSAMRIGDSTFSSGPLAADRGYLTIRRTRDGVHWDTDAWLVQKDHAPAKDGGYSAIANDKVFPGTGGVVYEGAPDAGTIKFQQFPLDLKHHCITFIVVGLSHPQNSNGMYFNFDRSMAGLYAGAEDSLYVTNMRTDKRGAVQIFGTTPGGMSIPGNSYGMWRYGAKSGDWQLDDVLTTCEASDRFWRAGMMVAPRFQQAPQPSKQTRDGQTTCATVTVLANEMCEKFPNTQGQWFLFNREEAGMAARRQLKGVKVVHKKTQQEFTAEIRTISNCGSAGDSYGFSTDPSQSTMSFSVGDQLFICGPY